MSASVYRVLQCSLVEVSSDLHFLARITPGFPTALDALLVVVFEGRYLFGYGKLCAAIDLRDILRSSMCSGGKHVL